MKNSRYQSFDILRTIEKSKASEPSASYGSSISFMQTFKLMPVSDKISYIRKGLDYSTIETTSKRLNNSVKSLLQLLDIPQTTYNKKKNEGSCMDSRDTELILAMNELIDYGISVFDDEEKFQRWMKKSNSHLSGEVPESLLDTMSGIYQVKCLLDRIEYGNFA